MDFTEQRVCHPTSQGYSGVNETCTQENLPSVLLWLTMGNARLQVPHKYSLSPSFRQMVELKFLDLSDVCHLTFFGQRHMHSSDECNFWAEELRASTP